MGTQYSATTGRRQQVRRELLRQYMRLQRELMEADPSASAYQSTMHAFRQMGYVLISSGFEDDLDRLLRIRVIDGGQPTRSRVVDREERPELHLMELLPTH
jgi:hypothetical protein